MAKTSLFHPSQRVDLEDLLFGVRNFPRNLRSEIATSSLGVGVLDGFGIKVPLPQTGTNTGIIQIFNGRGYDGGGRYIHAQTGTNTQSVLLGTADTEYWIEIELLDVNTDPDTRAFWDARVNNADPIPDGQEINIANVFTRSTRFFRVVQPIRSNPVGVRSGATYVPARFSDAGTLVVPLAVMRTNNSGQVEAGDADTTSDKNDMATVTVDSGSITVIKPPGYGEPTRLTQVQGFKTSDQRTRLFDRLQPPFLGGENEMLNDAITDIWARDLKSFADHVMTAIAQMKEGSGDASPYLTADIGQYYTCTLELVEPDWKYVDVKNLSNGVSSTLPVDPDDFINCTFQIMTGHWGGFYAQIAHNGETSGGDVTRIYLKHTSPIPEWKDMPVVGASGATCRVVHHRQVNWLTPATPMSGKRGYNALDAEMVTGRADWHADQTFTSLIQRLNANKYPMMTIAPPLPIALYDATTGEPLDTTVPRADVQTASASDIQTKFNTMQSASNRGGVIHFRQGTYDFDSVGTGPVFTVTKNSLIIEGEGAESTILDFDTNADVNTIFALSSVKDVEFRNIQLKGKGTILTAVGCENIRFTNCKVVSSVGASGGTIASVNLGIVTDFTIRDSHFSVTGAGFVCSDVERMKIQDTTFTTADPTSKANIKNLISMANTEDLEISGCYFKAFTAEYNIILTTATSFFFTNNWMNTLADLATSFGRVFIGGAVGALIQNNYLENDYLTTTITKYGISSLVFNNCVISQNVISNTDNAIIANSFVRSFATDNTLTSASDAEAIIFVTTDTSKICGNRITYGDSTGAKGISAGNLTNSHVEENSIVFSDGGTGIQANDVLRSSISRNMIVSTSASVACTAIVINGGELSMFNENSIKGDFDGGLLSVTQGLERCCVDQNVVDLDSITTGNVINIVGVTPGVNDCSISGNHMLLNGDTDVKGIFIDSVANRTTIANNSIKAASAQIGYGIHLDGIASGGSVSGNVIFGAVRGIEAYIGSAGTVVNNRLLQTTLYGVYVQVDGESEAPTVSHNMVSAATGNGIRVECVSSSPSPVQTIEGLSVCGNRITGVSTSVGIDIANTASVTIIPLGFDISNNYADGGLTFESDVDLQRARICGNTLTSGSIGINFAGDLLSSSVCDNKVKVTSSDDGISFGKVLDSIFTGNHVEVAGAAASGFYWDNTSHTVGLFMRNTLSNNSVVNTTAPTLPIGVTPWTAGAGADDWSSFAIGFQLSGDPDLNGDTILANGGVTDSIIVGNQVQGCHVAFLMHKSAQVMLSANMFLRASGQTPGTPRIGFVFSARDQAVNLSEYVSGGALDGPALLTASLESGLYNDWLGDGFIHTHAWPYNFEITT